MKFGQALVGLCTFAAPVAGLVNDNKDLQAHANSGSFLGNTMWHFGRNGLNIFSPDGGTLVKELGADTVCHNTTGYGGSGWRIRCDFYDVVSDGKKYVYAAVARGVAKINVFDIDSGNMVGSLPSCESPNDLDYHSLRDEVWIKCYDVGGISSFIDVVSASGISADIETNITLVDSDYSRGYLVTDPTLGDVGYATDRESPNLYKIDLSERKVMDDGKIPVPVAHGLEQIVYSKVNGHIYARSTVCCTCGFEGADMGPDCGRYGGRNVTVTTGPWANPDEIQSGQCGYRCDGNENTDIIGVYEIDTKTNKIVAQHLMQEGVGGDPYPSPDGQHVVMLARNGGTSIRILLAGAPGEPSTVFGDLELGFNSTDYEDDQVFNDYAFIEQNGMKMIVFASGTENKLAIVDVTNGNPEVSYVTFSDGDLSSYRARRQVEWAVGTNYVWVDGAGEDEVYVIDVVSKEVVNTISNVETTRLLSVDNHARNVQNALMQEYIQSMITADREANPPTVVEKTTTIVQEASQDSQESIEAQSVSAQSALPSADDYEDDNDVDIVGVIGLCLAAVAIVIGTMNLVFLSKMKSPAASSGGTPGNDEEVTLGSKDVA